MSHTQPFFRRAHFLWQRLRSRFNLKGGMLTEERKPLIKFGGVPRDLKWNEFYLYDAMRRGLPKKWEVATDSLIGGQSEAQLSLVDRDCVGTAFFEGKISLEPAEEMPDHIDKKPERVGYAVMYTQCNLDLEGATAIIIRLRSSESRKFYLNITTHTTFNPTGFLHQMYFVTKGGNEWEEFRMPIVGFAPVFLGQPSALLMHMDVTDIKSIGLMTKGPAGDFSLEIDSIDVDRDEEEDFFGQALDRHPLEPRKMLSFPNHGVVRVRPFMTERYRRQVIREESLYLPFGWAPDRVAEVERVRRRLGMPELIPQELCIDEEIKQALALLEGESNDEAGVDLIEAPDEEGVQSRRLHVGWQTNMAKQQLASQRDGADDRRDEEEDDESEAWDFERQGRRESEAEDEGRKQGG